MNDVWHDWALTLTVLVPLVGAIVIAVTPAAQEKAAKGLAVFFSFVTFLVTIGILAKYDYSDTVEQFPKAMQFDVNHQWIGAINARYHLGIDGIALPLVVLTGLLTFLCAIYSIKVIPNPGKPKALLSLMLLLEVGMMGAFVSLDLILFFIFFEIVLVPMFFMIAIWGGPNRNYASVKFFLYTLFGSAFMLLSFLAIYFKSAPHTFDMLQLAQQGNEFARSFQYIAFLGMFVGFAIKVPMWPLHTWLPDAHTEAPTIGSVLLAGILLKMGTYGFVRIAMPILPQAAKAYAPYIGILAVIAIIYGSLCCLAQKEIKRMIAFSSVGHMGFVMLGIATMTDTGLNAALFGNIAHGIITGMLFFIVGSVKERYHTGEIAEIGGGMLAKMPYLGSLLTFVAIASLGLPGLAGFWGEMFALLAAWSPAAGLHRGLFFALAVGGAIGTVLTAGYFLWLLQRVNLGVVPERWRQERFSDVVGVELSAWAPLLVLILAFGIYPKFVFGITDVAVKGMLAGMGVH
ncbi:MAG TPA: NADH-quinone oxidoreductase subunit M [Mycobacteriales bacterium]|jgi:NADH-quinone oxidoreductase subunit M|nr:NADH-quinone oxidoreductase subunit M [Mycobacteriales bacterium]